METEGWLAPASASAIGATYEAIGPTARVLVREVARAMTFDREEYAARVTDDVIATAHDALFGSLLTVHVGTVEEFEGWLEGDERWDIETVGSEHVENVVWHAAPAVDQVVAATFQDEREAAVATLRRQAFGRLYRELIHGERELVNDERE